ncbi:MAG TPA: hypothetical protein VGH27_17950 [Streptosporangiaceae bacterium]
MSAGESRDGVGEPGGGERAVEVTGLLATLDDLLELGGGEAVRIGARRVRVRAGGAGRGSGG